MDARYTSQKCSRCKQRHSTNRHKSRFHCKTCGFKAHADINASMNIRDDYILSTAPSESVEQASVNAPYVSTSSTG
ncbi:zinc ribbon domain-containing protein [Limnoraphis robusta]|uniref:zinc ribbon domain-containing protein n=1 Tax=Limnoraphis robusta TaxID=1118279 RepID=UPI00090929F9